MGRNKVPQLSWHPPAELGEWARAEAARRGHRGALSAMLTDALRLYREVLPQHRPSGAGEDRNEPDAGDAPGWSDMSLSRRMRGLIPISTDQLQQIGGVRS